MLLLLLFLTTALCYEKLSNSRILLMPGYGCCDKDYSEFQTICKKSNIPVDVVNIKRYEWLYIMRGMGNTKYWNYQCNPKDLFHWYLQKCKDSLFDSYEKNNQQPIILCGHSAGGWLGRFLLNNGTLYNEEKQSNDYVTALVTMGSPNTFHLKREQDTTRGCLQYVDQHFPGTYLKSQGIQYMTLGSRAKTINVQNKLNWKEKMVRNSYLTVINEKPIIEGDGVVPLISSHLQDAKQVTFDDVYHFPRKDKKYYWEENILHSWLNQLENMI